MSDRPVYRERLFVPTTWWAGAVGMGLVAVIVLVVTHLPAVVILGAGVVVTALCGWALYRYAADVTVSERGFGAGPALLPWWACGGVTALEGPAAREAFGRGADARAYLLLRSYCRGAVRVEVDDAGDPTPYWLVSTRSPVDLARHIGSFVVRD